MGKMGIFHPAMSPFLWKSSRGEDHFLVVFSLKGRRMLNLHHALKTFLGDGFLVSGFNPSEKY